MPGLTPTRTEISDRFSVLGFRVRSGRNPYYEVAIATDPALFHPDAKEQRTESNFFSTHHAGPLPTEHGEAMYFIPPHVLRHSVHRWHRHLQQQHRGCPDGCRTLARPGLPRRRQRRHERYSRWLS